MLKTRREHALQEILPHFSEQVLKGNVLFGSLGKENQEKGP